MRKLFLILAAMLFATINIAAKDSSHEIVKSMIEPVLAEGWDYEADSIKISMDLSGGNFHFQLKNNTQHRVYIEWENSRLNGERPFFGTDNLLSSKNKKEDEAVMSGSFSMLQSLYVSNPYYTGLSSYSSWATVPYNTAMIKRVGSGFIQFNLPLRFENGKTKDIKFNLEIKWINTADINQVKIGMKDKDVKKLIGTPDYKEKPDKETQIWQYTNNAKITFKEDKVTNIEKTK